MVDLTHPKCPKLSPRRDGPNDVAPCRSAPSHRELRCRCWVAPAPHLQSVVMPNAPWLNSTQLGFPLQLNRTKPTCTNIFVQHINLTTTTSGVTGTISWVPIPTLKPRPSLFLYQHLHTRPLFIASPLMVRVPHRTPLPRQPPCPIVV